MITQKCNADNGATCISVIILKLRGGNCIVFDAAKKHPETGEHPKVYCTLSFDYHHASKSQIRP